MASTLPLEIWREIAKHIIPYQYLLKLYSVNAALFQIIMEEKYQVVDFNDHRRFLQYLDRLELLVASQNVRVLYIDPGLIPAVHAKYNTRGFIAKILQHPARYVSKTGQTWQRMLKLLRSVPNVQSLELSYNRTSDQPQDVERSRLMTVTAHEALGCTLSTLRLHLIAEVVHSIISPSMVFPLLENLSLWLWKRDPSAVSDTESLGLFINNHRATLLCLHIETYGVNISHLFLTLEHFSRLIKFNLLDFYFHSSTSLIHFLRTHAEQLEDLSLRVMSHSEFDHFYPSTTPDDWSTYNKFLDFPLPKLRALDIYLQYFENIEKTTRYLQRFSESLVVLRLCGNMLKDSEIEDLLQALTSPSSVLRTLGMDVENFSTALVELIAELPKLESLELRYKFRYGDPHSALFTRWKFGTLRESTCRDRITILSFDLRRSLHGR